MAYLLTPVVYLGGVEWVGHLLIGLCLAIAAILAVRVGKRLDLSPREAGAAAMILVASPAVLAMNMTVMPDVPAMTAGLWAVERALAFRDQGQWHLVGVGTR